jgi:hypothetical protein
VTRQLTAELIPHVLEAHGRRGAWRPEALSCWEPACGEGHMAPGLAARFGAVHLSDIADHGVRRTRATHDCRFRQSDFLGTRDVDFHAPEGGVDWIVTNPPFRLGAQFALRALCTARLGVALFVRLAWAETRARFELHRSFPPSALASFAERVPLVRGRYDPDASSATAYAWVIWTRLCPDAPWGLPGGLRLWLDVPPGARARFELASDREDWA